MEDLLIEQENKLPIKYNKDYYVIQANELVRSKQDDLSLLEAKLIRLAIAQVLKGDTDLKTYTCNVVDLADFLKLNKQNVYRDVKELSINLMKKSIFIRDRTSKQGKENYKILHWIDYVEYRDGEITFKLSEHLKPYLLGLEELFSKYQYGEIIKLPTTYSIKLYELLYSYANLSFRNNLENNNYLGFELEKDEIYLSISYLRDFFNCKDKYINTGDFIKRVIKPAIEDINENTVYPCSYTLVKAHSKIIGVKFKLGNWTSTAGDIVLKNFKLREGIE